MKLLLSLPLFAQSEGGGDIIPLLAVLALVIVVVAGVWKTFVKAGQPGWAAIIPIYNIVVLLEIAKRPIWWILLLFIPLVNLIVSLVIVLDIARNFGKGALFGVGLAIFPFIFYPILGFGDAQYRPA